ncbi:MAG TPA: hypothetical protein VNH18_22880, partial [Bryobacteraceae bacterium]|nr:hypothetical protein [Bryobacteraceae bacterium]
GPATEALHLEMVPPTGTASSAHASVSVNSLGLIDNLQIAASGLQPGKPYKLVFVGDGRLQDLAAFSAGIGGTAIAQTLGPLKRTVGPSQGESTMRLEVRLNENGRDDLVLQQAGAPLTASR